MVFQHFSLFETLSVAQNIALAMGAAAGTPKQLEPKIREVSQRYGMALEPSDLSTACRSANVSGWKSFVA